MSLLEKIAAAGIVGAGGAGFPTHMKLDCKVEYFLVNAAECEPLLHTDKYLMRTFPDQIVEAAETVAKHVEASQVYIAVKGVNTEEIAALKKAVGARKSAVKIFELDNYYPAGDEQCLVYDITGRIVPPGGIPLKVGAAVSNAATMLNVYDALRDKPVTHKYLTVAGEVAKPQVLRVPIGTTFAQCLAACGGATISDYLLINGGPMMGKVSPGAEAGKLYVTKTCSGILVVGAEDNFVARTQKLTVQQILNRAKSACIQCSYCTDLCPRRLIGHQIRPHRIMRKMAMHDLESPIIPDDIYRESLICSQCGVCETFACPMGLSPRQVNKYVKDNLKGEKFTQTEDLVASPLRPYRKIAPRKMMARMGMSGLYNNKPETFLDLAVERVHIPCSQHIGAPAEAVVSKGDTVNVGQLIAKAAEGKPSANIHASIAGRVVRVGSVIEIEGGK